MLSCIRFSILFDLVEIVIERNSSYSSKVEIFDSAFAGCTNLMTIDLTKAYSIGKAAFSGCTNLKAVTIPNDIVLEENVFRYSGLEEVIIPEGIKGIPVSAFTGCNSLRKVVIPSTIKKLEPKSFSNLLSLSEVVISEGLEKLGGESFSNCPSLVEVNLPASLVEIITYISYDEKYKYPFSNSSNLRVINVNSKNEKYFSDGGIIYSKEENKLLFCPEGIVTVKEGITNIGASFESCKKLTGINLPTTLTSISFNAFKNCEWLTTITIPKDVSYIALSEDSSLNFSYAFSGCSNLKSIVVAEENEYFYSHYGALYDKKKQEFLYCPEGITGSCSIMEGTLSVGELAFKYANNITEIVIPSSVTFINSENFYSKFTFDQNLKKLEMIVVSSENLNYSSHEGVLYDKINKTLLFFPKAKTGNYLILEGTLKIMNYAFNGCSVITNIKIPNSVTEIGDSVFDNCNMLRYIIIPSSVEIIANVMLHSSYYSSNKTIVYLEHKEKPSGFNNHFAPQGQVFWKDEWHYDENGEPVINN